ncbi:MAG: PHP domain-containing protein [Clostridia bacterium]|nr:PHP domain-containing protein [Clostridia bacterium]
MIEKLNGGTAKTRIEALKALVEKMNNGEIKKPETGKDVNNHIHSIYSFSPYSPTKAVWMAYNAGLNTAGIMDHDSVSGAYEFIEAAEVIGMAATVGAEVRVSMKNTRLAGKKINNPDQDEVAYVAMHGIPHTQIDKVKEFFVPVTEARLKRNRAMVAKINEIMAPHGVSLDFDGEVVPISMLHEGGSVTERHILFALSNKLVERFGRGKAIVDFLKNDMKIALSEKIEGFLTDVNNDCYEYDLLGALKSDLVEKFYIPATDECPDVRDVVKLADEVGAILAYAYLGDVGNSVTGDKKTQKFEDDYLDLLFDEIKALGFKAVTYMPSRNTKEQVERVMALCDKYGFFQISGEDINTPRQSFICMAQRDPMFSHLEEATWALIGHEKAATENLEDAMFSAKTIEKYPDIKERTKYFSNIGRK